MVKFHLWHLFVNGRFDIQVTMTGPSLFNLPIAFGSLLVKCLTSSQSHTKLIHPESHSRLKTIFDAILNK